MASRPAPAHREWDTGLKRPTRPCPRDFRETYLQLGQSKEIEDHYRTNWRVIIRWIEESGGDELRQARSAVSGQPVRPGSRSDRARRYVLGLMLPPDGRAGSGERRRRHSEATR